MAAPSSKNDSNRLTLDSFSTALVLIPPAPIQARVNTLRTANDKSFPRWTAHMTLLFPFVAPDTLPAAVAVLRNALAGASIQPFEMALEQIGRFEARDYETVYLTPSPASVHAVQQLWSVLANAVGYKGRSIVPHMTLGQTSHRQHDIKLLEGKGKTLIARGRLQWTVTSVVVLRKDETDEGRMKIWGELLLTNTQPRIESFIALDAPRSYHFDKNASAWLPQSASDGQASLSTFHTLKVVTFNILHDLYHPCTSRYDRIKSCILDLDGDIVCLQEVTDHFLGRLLEDDGIRSKWTWCNYGLDSVMENERNIVVLTKEGISFFWNRVVLGGRHKAAVFLSIPFKDHVSVTLAAIHLTAGRFSQQIQAKQEEFRAVVKNLQQRYPDNEWIIAGDTNFDRDLSQSFSQFDDVLTDVWHSYHQEGSLAYNATYDPSRNALAAATAHSDKSAERYDRIYVKRDSTFHVNQVALSVTADHDQPSSDHWPLAASFSLTSSPLAEVPTSTYVEVQTQLPDQPPGDIQVSDADLLKFVQFAAVIPTAVNQQHKEHAVKVLCNVIGASCDGAVDGSPAEVSSTRTSLSSADGDLPLTPSSVPVSSPVRLALVPVGSFALGVDFPESDVDCLVVGNVNTSTFWTLVKHRITTQDAHKDGGHPSVLIKLRRFVKDAAVQMMMLEFDGIKIDLQYCPAAKLAESWNEVSKLPSGSTLFALPVSSLRTLNAHRDRLWLQKRIPSQPIFQLAYRYIKLLCLRRGIFGARFGYLGGIHISILLVRVASSSTCKASASDLVKSFFQTYAAFDWAGDCVSISSPETTYPRKSREPMVILSPERPVVNVSASASAHTLYTVRAEFARVHSELSRGTPWADVCGAEVHATGFLAQFDRFLKLDVNYWGGSCMRARALVGFVESKLVHLLVELHSANPRVVARLWPARLVDAPADDTSGASHVGGFYLIGLKGDEEMTDARPKALIGVVRAFEENVRNNDNYYDPAEAFVALFECERSALGTSVAPDRHVWSDGEIDEPDSSDSEPDVAPEDADDMERFLNHSSSRAKKETRRASGQRTSHVPAEKLRTSADVYHRLMWDPERDQDDYVIGYEDRFQGVKEMPLRSWKREVEDETFIPFHRVMHFRRKSDDTVVWDRRTKTDHVFGSGVRVSQ